MSVRDSLTGLYTSDFFWEEARRISDGRYAPIGILVFDLDGMKLINDTFGNQVGNEALISAANVLRNCLRSSDIIARIKGDKFAVLLLNVDQYTIQGILERFYHAVQQFNNCKPKVLLSLSIGYALQWKVPVDGQSLFREADNIMYQDKMQHFGSRHNVIFQALTNTMEAKDFAAHGHCDRLQYLVGVMDQSNYRINGLQLLARFHDLGKVDIPDEILFKKGPFTEEESQQMRQHSEIGQRIAQAMPNLDPIANWILLHHERWDGKGYPRGLQGEQIPLACRILAIADAYDAMTSDRPYRKAMSSGEAMAELRRCSGTQFDPDLVEQFVQFMGQLYPV